MRERGKRKAKMKRYSERRKGERERKEIGIDEKIQ